MYAWQTWWSWNVESRESERQTSNLAKSFAQDTDSTFETADSALQSLQLWSELRGIGPAQRGALQRLTNLRFKTLPQIHEIFIFDATGRFVVGTGSGTRFVRINFSDRDYFRYAAQHDAPDSFINGPMVSKRDGDWVVTLSRRLNNLDGSFLGVASASLSLKYFETIYGQVELGRSGVITLVHSNGVLLVRTPFDHRYVGRNVLRGALFRRIAAAPAGEFTAKSSLDGIVRVVAYQKLAHFPLITFVAIPTDEVFGVWRRASIIGFVSVCALIATIVVLARFLLTEIGDREHAQQRLAQLAFIDGLTELANRRHFDTTLEKEWRRAARETSTLALLMIDADAFKSYNDRYGHQMGDDVLKTIAACIQASIDRSTDLGARYGGEEFAVLLPSTSLEGGLIVAGKIQAALLAKRIAHRESPSGFATMSIGVAAHMPARESEPAEFVGAADAALYRAKQNGRNRIETAPGIGAPA